MLYSQKQIVDKFGADYIADDYTFVMGIDARFTTHIAERFKGKRVLETCTGAGFSTIALARCAHHVFTVEINPQHRAQALSNIHKAGVSDCVTSIEGDILNPDIWSSIPDVDAAFLDPDWAVTNSKHIYRFIHSNTLPPADKLLSMVLRKTPHVALILSPMVDVLEFTHLKEHECESLFLENNHELFCLYFGSLIQTKGLSSYSV